MGVVRTPLLLLLVVAGLVGVGEARQAKTLADITSTGSVTACADPDNLPFSSADAQWSGYDAEIVRALATELGAHAEFKWVGTRSGRAAIRNLLDGECDLFPGLPVSPGFAEEYPQLAFSRPYYTMRHVIVARAGEPVAGPADLKGVVTAVEALSAGDLFLLGKGYPRRAYRTQEAAFRAVQAGEIRAALLWAPIAGWLAKRSGAPDVFLVSLSDPDLAVPFGIGLLRKDPALKAAVDDAVERLQQRGVIHDSLGRYGVPLARAGMPNRRGVGPAVWRAREGMRTRQVAQVQGAKSDLVEGGFIFQENCAECHRSDGRGGGSVPRLQAYPIGADRRFVQTVLDGRNEHGMPPWRGLLTEAQVRAVLQYVRALVPTVEVVAGVPPEERARQVFSQICATCHGREGGGTRIAPSLQAFKGTDDEFVNAVLDGRPGTAMAPFNELLSVEVAWKLREYVRELARVN